MKREEKEEIFQRVRKNKKKIKTRKAKKSKNFKQEANWKIEKLNEKLRKINFLGWKAVTD